MRRRHARPSTYAEAALIFAALGDKTRLYLVARLCKEGPMPIVRLASGMALSRQAITKHLNALAQAGLARGSRSGRQRIWELRPARISEAQAYIDQISRDWDAALDRLRALVEK